jgi:putative SOS response-associated peptidase YedK
MTTEPNELTQSINHERMPVLMSDPDDFETWLSGSTEEAFKLARRDAHCTVGVRARGLT